MTAAERALSDGRAAPSGADLVAIFVGVVAGTSIVFEITLTSGAVVHFGESIDTVQTDLREVSPTVFLGVPRIWEKMHSRESPSFFRYFSQRSLASFLGSP